MTVERTTDLPEFDNPPVVETVLSAQFEPLHLMRAAHFGRFWSDIKDQYPTTEERMPLDAVVERFPEPTRQRVGLKLQTVELPRVWFVTADDSELVQVQSDRFIKNWRETARRLDYPRYTSVKEGFALDFQNFRVFAEREKLGELRINQCEVTYVNHIVADEVWAEHRDIDKVFRFWNQPSAPFPGRVEDLSFHSRFPIRDDLGRPVGRLHVDLQSALRKADKKPMFVFNLTARGMLGDGTEFFDLGREWIVRSFAEMTTSEMHTVWKRR